MASDENGGGDERCRRAEELDRQGAVLAERRARLEVELRLHRAELRARGARSAEGSSVSPGERPAEEHRLAFELTPGDHALWCEVVRKLRREVDPELTEGECIEHLAREVLRGAGEPEGVGSTRGDPAGPGEASGATLGRSRWRAS